MFELAHYAKLYHHTIYCKTEAELQQHIHSVRLYLSKCGYNMPPQKFPYNPKDTTTWKYVEYNGEKHLTQEMTSGRDKQGHLRIIATGTALNPNYKYAK